MKLRKKIFSRILGVGIITTASVSAISVYHNINKKNNNTISEKIKNKKYSYNGKPHFNETTTLNPLDNFSTSNSSDFLSQGADVNTLTKRTNSFNYSYSVNTIGAQVTGIWMHRDDQIGYKFELMDITTGQSMGVGWGTHNVDDDRDHINHRVILNINRDVNYTHSFELTTRFYYAQYGDHHIDKKNYTLHSQKGSWITKDYGGGQTLIPSSTFYKIFNEKYKHTNESVNLKLNSIEFPFRSEGAYHTRYWNDTHPQATIDSGTGYSVSAELTETKTKYTGISKQEAQQVLPNIFTILKNTTQQKDFLKGGKYWLSATNPPSLHIGLNNDLFKAYDERQWALGFNVNNDPNLNDEKKKKLQTLLEQYKATKENFDSIRDKLIDGDVDSVDINSYSVPKWADYLKPSAPKVNNMNIIEWLMSKKDIGFKGFKGDERTNYYFLSQFLKNQKDNHIKLNYINDGI